MKLTRRTLLATAAALPALPARAATPAELTAGETVLDVLGKPATVLSLTGEAGAQGLAFEEGQVFWVAFTNGLAQSTLLHWHGLLPPQAQDGTPGLSGPAVLAGKSRTYDFRLPRPATAWAHPLGLQQQRLLSAPVIVHARTDTPAHEHIVMLADFAFASPEALQAALGGDTGDGETIAYDAYLANGTTLDDPEIVPVTPGETLRLRIINAACATDFTVSTGSLVARLIAVDGNPIVARDGTRFPIALGQRLDLLLRIPPDGAHAIIASAAGSLGRAGIVLATPGARVEKLARSAAAPTPFDAGFEQRLAASHRLPAMRPDRQLAIRLEGQPRPYAWRISGDALEVRAGERVEIAVANTTDRLQAIHLHGHFFEVVGMGDARLAGALRDTVAIAAGETMTLAFDANHPGSWLLQSTHLYRLLAGMAAILRYVA